MRTILKDVFTALFLGMLLPGLLLSFAAAWVKTEQPIETSLLPAIPAQPMTLRLDDSVKEMDLETYLVGVVLAEMPASFEVEALKAQSVAARTYTKKAMQSAGKHGDSSLCADPGCCQAYISEESYLAQGGTPENLEKVRSAVLSTNGLTLTYDGALIEATYFSCSGGRTEDALAVWGADFPYLQSVESPGEEGAPYDTDTLTLSPAEFASALGLSLTGSPRSWIGTVAFTEGGGVDTMEIGGEVFSGTDLRSALGLRSTAFTALTTDQRITITTRGYGHRVGMSQYGAEAMALSGHSFREILSHYYPGTELA